MSSHHTNATADSSPRPESGTAGASVPLVAHPGWYRREEAIMGTSISVELFATTRAQADTAIDAVMAEMHRINATMSPHKVTSELSLINMGAADAEDYYKSALYGDPVEVTGTKQPMTPADSIFDWIYSFDQWKTFSALN